MNIVRFARDALFIKRRIKAMKIIFILKISLTTLKEK